MRMIKGNFLDNLCFYNYPVIKTKYDNNNIYIYIYIYMYEIKYIFVYKQRSCVSPDVIFLILFYRFE